MIGLLIHGLFNLILGLVEPGAGPRHRFRRQHQAGSDQRLTRGEETITATLLVLSAIGIIDVVLDVASNAHGIGCVVVDGAAELLGIFTDDGEARVNLAQTLVTERVGVRDVGSNEAVGAGEVR